MNHKSALHARIYNRLEVDRPENALAVIGLLDGFGMLEGAKFGSSEPVREPWTGDAAQRAVVMLNEQRSLMVNNGKKQFNIYISWFRARSRPWFWTIDLGRRWLVEPALTTFIRMCKQLLIEQDIDLLSCARPEDWFQKHDILDQNGAMLLRQGAGLEPGKGLPGIYWLNGFGPSLNQHFKARLPEVERLAIVDSKATDRLLFRAYPKADDGDADSRRRAEQAIVDILGCAHFFILRASTTARFPRRDPVPGVCDAPKR